MSQIAHRLPRAKVEWWDSTQAYVRCPLCQDIHRHCSLFTDGWYGVRQTRQSDCHQINNCRYELEFPFNALGEVGYDIDKETVLFVAGGADPASYFARREGNSVSIDLSGRRKWTEALETVAIPGDDSYKRIDLALDHVVNGNIQGVRHYLDHSKEADLFVHGVEAEVIHFCHDSDDDNDSDPADEDNILVTGKTALHFAACEEFPEMVQLLLERGANPNAQDSEGRTPLHEAALWGRLQSVEILLRYGADQELECVRGGLHLRAIEFAKPSRENQIERHKRNPREKTYERDRDREAVFCLLQNVANEPSRSVSGFAFASSPSPEGLRTLIAQFEVPKREKTIGVLYRGSQLPCIAAMSGWGYQDLEQTNIQIAGKDWTNEVRRLCGTVGHYLARKRSKDQGMPGQYNACHAEKQLIAFFVHKHLFLPDEVGEDTKSAELSLGAAFSSLNLREIGGNRRKLSALQKAEPPVSLRKATIMVCREICSDCKEFVARTNMTLGLDITLFHRCLDSGCKVCPK